MNNFQINLSETNLSISHEFTKFTLNFTMKIMILKGMPSSLILPPLHSHEEIILALR